MLVGIFFVFFAGGVSKEDFIAQADDICRASFDESAEISETIDFEAGGLSGAATLFRETTPILENQTREIRALERPEEDQELLQDWLNTQGRLVEVFQTAADEAAAGEQRGFTEASTEANEIQAHASRLASEYGFEVCGITTTS